MASIYDTIKTIGWLRMRGCAHPNLSYLNLIFSICGSFPLSIITSASLSLFHSIDTWLTDVFGLIIYLLSYFIFRLGSGNSSILYNSIVYSSLGDGIVFIKVSSGVKM